MTILPHPQPGKMKFKAKINRKHNNGQKFCIKILHKNLQQLAVERVGLSLGTIGGGINSCPAITVECTVQSIQVMIMM
jgi:hypothetical protein